MSPAEYDPYQPGGGQYQPGAGPYPPGAGGPYPPAGGPYPSGGDEPPPGPSRGLVIGIFVGLGVLALLIGVGAAHVVNSRNTSPDAASLHPAATSTPATQAATTATTPSSTTPAATPSPTRPPDYHAIPADVFSEKGLDFGFLTKVTSTGGKVTLRFDRATFYTGKEATEHNQGKPPDDDYLIENTNPLLRSFDLDPKASITGADRLLTNPTTAGRQPLTLAQFVTNAQAALSSSTAGIPVWLRHTDGLTGPVTALAEQYLP